MFTPFLVEPTIIFLQKRYKKKEGIKEALKHLPLMIPIVNFIHTLELTKVKYSQKIERIRMDAGKPTLTEGFAVIFFLNIMLNS